MANGDLPIEGQGDVLPSRIRQEQYGAMDTALARAEARRLRQVLGEMEGTGFLRSGETQRRVAGEVYGPGVEARRGGILSSLEAGAGQQRQERLSLLDFNRQRQFAEEENRRALARMEKQASVQRALLQLQADLSGEEWSWGAVVGDVVGAGAGAGIGKMGADYAASRDRGYSGDYQDNFYEEDPNAYWRGLGEE